MIPEITDKYIKKFQQNIITWYNNEKRDLPWRRTSDPYKIWISEIMLQQTQVIKVIDYYLKFTEAFPDIISLAQAELDDVLKKWEGLGYYARARNMHRAANEIVKNHNGNFPNQYEQIIKLPGIGHYSAAAISSIAFNLNHAVVDGNVIRVLARLFEINTLPKSNDGKKLFNNIAEKLLDHSQAGTYNQAVMELGALVCTPQNPKCQVCPVIDLCRSQKNGHQLNYPQKTPAKSRPHFQIAAGIIFHKNKILIARRPENGLLGGLWEFPGGKQEKDETLEQTVVREVKEETDIRVRVDSLLTTVNHQYSHFTITLHAFMCCYISGDPKPIGCTELQWVEKKQLDDFAFPKANVKIIEKLKTVEL